jgi:hypothetical protein
MQQLERKSGKPLMLAEIGIRSQTNDFREPWKGHDKEQASQADQASYFAATCNILSDATTGASGGAIRSEPSASGALLQSVPAGTNLRLVGEPVAAASGTWQQVQDPATGATGYTSSRELDGRAVFMGAYVWFATIGSLTYDAGKDQDYTVFSKQAEPIIGDCFGKRIGAAAP